MNFFGRFWKRYHFTIIFIVLQLISISLLTRSNIAVKNAYLNSSNAVSGYLFELNTEVFSYFRLRKINRELIEQNAILTEELKGYQKTQANFEYLFEDSLNQRKYIYRTARVINNSVNKQHNYLTINKGGAHGIKPEMGVVGNRGLVGIVNSVSENYATVISMLNTKVFISGMHQESGEFGTVVWDGRNPEIVRLKEISRHVDVQIGDLIATSGYSSSFPRGIVIGAVAKVDRPAGENFLVIEVELATNFKQLDFVEVIENMDVIEIKELEERKENG